MTTCNDPRCPLNRQGVSHEDHEAILGKPVKNPCNDPRCAMNRMGMSHETHDERQTGHETHDERQTGHEEEPKQKKSKQSNDDEFIGSNYDVYQEQGRQVHQENPNKLSREKILEERRRREGQTIEQEVQAEIKQRERSRIFSRSKQNLPSIDHILHNSDPYKIFNIARDCTCDEVKSKYKELSKVYNASRGSVNRTHKEQEKLTKTQSKINATYDILRKKHCE